MDTGERVAGRYRLETRIGAGGMGVVWRAVDEHLDRTVAVKRVLIDESATPAQRRLAVDRLRREARIAARLHHPHVVTLFEMVEDGDDAWLVMEYLPSQDLSGLVAQHGTLAPRRAARIGAQIAQALAEAHRASVTHRDVTPRNILVTADDVAKLTDFGISRAAGDTTLTGTGPVEGVPAYLAPEVAAGRVATSASDVFALGASLYAAVEGTPPWGRGDDVLAVLRRATKGVVPPPTRAGPLTPVLHAMLHRRPADRPTAAQVQRLLADVADGVSVRSRVPSRRGRILLAACTVLALAAGGVGLAILPDRTDTTVGAADRPAGDEGSEAFIRPGSGVPAEYLTLIVDAGTTCREPGVSPALVASILEAESGYDPDLADPAANEFGIARWTPEVLAPFLPVGQQSQVPTPPFPPETSIPAVGRYLCVLAGRLAGVPGEPPLLLAAAYRTSADTVRRDGIPPRLADYIDRVRGNLERIRPMP